MNNNDHHNYVDNEIKGMISSLKARKLIQATYKCEVCDKVFTSSIFLQAHTKIHAVN